MRKISAIFISILLAINNTLPVLALEKDTVDSSTIPWTSSDNVNSSTISWTSSDNINQGDRFDPLEGVQALDKDGKNMTESLKIEGKVDTNVVGQHKLEYYFNDSENNKIEKTRIINVIESKKQANNTDNKIDTDEKEVSNLDISTYPNTINIRGMSVDGFGDLKASITFDLNNKKIAVDSNAYMLDDNFSDKQYFGIKLISASGEIKIDENFNGNSSGDDIKKQLEGVSFDYGDLIQFYHVEPNNGLEITGDVIGGAPTESEKVNEAFEIIPTGLSKKIIEPPNINISNPNIGEFESGSDITDDMLMNYVEATDEIEGNITDRVTCSFDENQIGNQDISYSVTNIFGKTSTATANINITPTDPSTYPNTIVVKGILVGGNVGDIKAKITFDKDTKQIKVTESSGYMLHDYYKGKKYFGIKIISNDGNIRLNETFNGDNSGDDIRDTLDGFEFKYGDFIELFHDEVDRLNITGDIIDNDPPIASKKFVYKITKNGLKDAKAIPVVKGVTDISILKGTNATRDVIMTGITATDITGDITNMVQYSNNLITDKVGFCTIKYTITNSYNYTVEVERKIYVKTEPKIELRPNVSLTLELGSIENNESAIKDYLKSLVNVTDEDQVDIANSLVISNLANSQVISDILNPDSEGSYNIKYSVTDKDGYKAECELTINVIRTISVTVPTKIPFQVVTNLKDKNADPFISGVMKIKNNNTSNVDVFVESFTKQTDSGDLEIVDPRTYSDWNQLPTDESMKKMALGMYAVSGLTSNSQLDKSNPLWFEESKTNNINIGTIPRATTIGNPSECKLSFTSKHGKNFIGGRSKGKFNLVFRFE